jgi:hypothetical protein
VGAPAATAAGQARAEGAALPREVSEGAAATAASEGFTAHFKKYFGNEEEVRAISYLPLAHIFERAGMECQSLVHGKIHIFFAESLDTFVQDIQRARPTFFASVPRLWLKFQQGVFSKMPPKKLGRLLSIPFLGRIVAKKVLTGLGLGFVGARMDHGLAVLRGLVRRPDTRCILLGARDVIFLAPPQMTLHLPRGARVSLFPMGAVAGRSTGLKWPIEGIGFAPDGEIGTSNSALGPKSAPLHLEFSARKMLVILPISQLDPVLTAFSRVR